MVRSMTVVMSSVVAVWVGVLRLLLLGLVLIIVIGHQTNFVELLLDELKRHVESSFLRHLVDFFGFNILLLDEGFKNSEPFAGSSMRHAVATSSALALAAVILFLFSFFWKDGDHHDRVLIRSVDLQEGVR